MNTFLIALQADSYHLIGPFADIPAAYRHGGQPFNAATDGPVLRCVTLTNPRAIPKLVSPEGTLETTVFPTGDERTDAIFAEIAGERAVQDEQWGGPAHDDLHHPMEWADFVNVQLDKLADAGGGDPAIQTEAKEAEMVRARMIKIAALAIAAVESIDRMTETGGYDRALAGDIPS